MLVWTGGKGPNEVADYDIDWTLRLAGDTITGSTWSITVGDESAETTLVINSQSNSTTLAKVWLAAGTLGVNYTLQNQVTTANGDTLTENVQLLIKNR